MYRSKTLASNYRGPISLSAGFLSNVTDNGFAIHVSARSRQEEMPTGRLHTLEFEPTTSMRGVRRPNHWVLPLITSSNEPLWIHDFWDSILSVLDMHGS